MQGVPIPEIISEIREIVFNPLRLAIKNVWKEPESQEYSAYRFDLGNRKVIFRNAKATPKKTGQFVTLWKRNPHGETQPLDCSDDFDWAIICVKSGNRQGLFVFPKPALLQHGVISGDSKEGKRGFRIYPAWDNATNSQAMKTQRWQLAYFLETATEVNLETAKKLFA